MPSLELRLLGSFEVRLDGKPVVGFESGRVRALLCLLAGEAPRLQFRESLAELLWPGWPQKSAMTNLRGALSDLRKNLRDQQAQPPFLRISREAIQLNLESTVWVDALEFQRTGEVELYRGPFLEGFGLSDSPGFSEWLLSKRAYYQRQALAALGKKAQECEERGEYAHGLALARRELEIEPWLEEGHARVMRLLALSGERSQALAQYETCKGILEKDLGAAPARETRELAERIRSGEWPGGNTLKGEVKTAPNVEEEPKHNLPAQLTSFIGREKEIAELRGLLRNKETRLVTLTGAGGTGKTRLALQVGGGMLDAFPGGVWQAELAPLADPELVPRTVLSALGQMELPGKSTLQQLRDYLRGKELLLVLDNCEHLVEACAELAQALLQAAPGLKILASSREILGVAGEQAYRVPPMSKPDPREKLPLEELGRYEAMRLFVERAQTAATGFVLSEENASAVARITQRLDGIPLALELAAARLRVLSVDQIAVRLQDAFRLLTGGSRTALPRHQTLTALIEWSYNLLSEEEQRGLRALSVFAGSWTLEAAEALIGVEALDLLEGLADKSLIFTTPSAAGEMRYRMLETVRQYAHARLVEAGEAETLRARHLAYYLELGERLEPKLRGREQIPTLDRLEGELDNLRLALEWGLQADVESELRLAAALQWFWHIRSRYSEGIRWLEQGLAQEEPHSQQVGSALVKAKAQTALAYHRMILQDVYANVQDLLEEALRTYRGAPNVPPGIEAWTLTWLSGYLVLKADIQGPLLARQALELHRERGDIHGMAESLEVLARCAVNQEKATQFRQEYLALEEINGDVEGIATALLFLGFPSLINGDDEESRRYFLASLPYYQKVGNPYMVAYVLGALAIVDIGHNRAAVPGYLEKVLHVGAGSREPLSALCWTFLFALGEGDFDRAEQIIAEVEREAQPEGDVADWPDWYFLQARLARLRGGSSTAHAYVETGLKVEPKIGFVSWLTHEQTKAFLMLELGYLALQEDNLARAAENMRKAFDLCAHNSVEWLRLLMDGVGLLAAREKKTERAVRLFGTKFNEWAYNTLSPGERAERDALFAELRAELGAERYEQLRTEGRGMNINQVLALVKERP